jgi:predicted DNA-binding protein with PD1-like motif
VQAQVFLSEKPAVSKLLTYGSPTGDVAKIYSLRSGASVPEELVAIARGEDIATAKVEAIGGVDRLTLAYFNDKTKKYEEHKFDEFLEVTSLLGNITTKDGEPFLHAHGTFGRKDLSVVGGHVMSARVHPIMEVVVIPTDNKALRKFDEESGLNVIFETK